MLLSGSFDELPVQHGPGGRAGRPGGSSCFTEWPARPPPFFLELRTKQKLHEKKTHK